MASGTLPSTADCAAKQLGDRLFAERHALARRWQAGMSRRGLDAGSADGPFWDAALVGVIDDIAGSLISGIHPQPADREEARRAAALLGELRFAQRVPIGELLEELHALEDALQHFLEKESARLSPPVAAPAVEGVMRSIRLELRQLEHRAIESYGAGYTRTIETLTERLTQFSRLVSHEIRRPLAVLRVLARTLTVTVGDVDGVRMVEILDRSVARLADATGDLDRGSAPTGSRTSG